MIRKAIARDIDAITAIYDAILDAQDEGRFTIGWQRGIYPTRETALGALARDDLFVLEQDGRVLASGIINHHQEEAYPLGNWEYPAADDKIMVMHTLVVDPDENSRGLARKMLEYYADYARSHGCTVLRFDTGSINARARALYASWGAKEIGIVPLESENFSDDTDLVLLEKKL